MTSFIQPIPLPLHSRRTTVSPSVVNTPPTTCRASKPAQPYLSHTNAALNRAIRDRSPSRILPLLADHLAQPHQPESSQLWRNAVHACLQARNPTAVAAVLFRGLSSPLASNLRIAYFVQPLRFLASIPKWNLVFSLLDKMWLVGNAVTPDEKLIVNLANAAVHHRAYQICLKLFRLMRAHGTQMGPFSYSVLLKSHGRAGNVVAVNSVLAEIQLHHTPVDSILFNSAVDALVRCNNMGAALRLLAEDEYRPLLDVASYNTIIKGFAGRGLVADAFRVLDRMNANHCTPNDVTRNTLLLACVQAGDLDRAKSLIDATDSNGGLYQQNNPLLPQQQPQHLSTASSTAKHTKPSPHQISSSSKQLRIGLTSLMAGLADSGQLDEAMRLMDHMRELHLPPSSITYAALISSCIRCKAFAQARSLFHSFVEDELVSLPVCNAYISGLCRSGQTEQVMQAAATLDAMLSGNVCVAPDVDCFNSLLDGLVRIRDFAKAEEIMEIMHSNRTFRPNIVSYTIMMKGYGDTRQYRKAKGIFREMWRRRQRPDRVALNAFIKICIRSGDRNAAIRVLEHMELKKGAVCPGIQSYSPIITSYMREDNYDKSWEVYKRMRSQGIPLNEHFIQLLTMQFFDREGHKKPKLTERCAELLKHGLNDGVNVKVLRKCRRLMLTKLPNQRSRNLLDHLANEPEFHSVSEQIFARHGWNEINSGWRAL
ncbi:Pentatricopeptide repeat-containing protein [Gracilariopsis chorda]|uniref:Pentatricopeptide repeat-containing protein n=1 Tax=Gracilariopsis chorda TaxID=448386 RepID=A0A2V3IXV2_9FLOR|nr:Pentatricopeptide repeat-containing protein [Gracilariopsis chorda]|eukprot:PXF46895.1 Pentatricopeptide repeat-containing protein [Gracilariopsis chorda]